MLFTLSGILTDCKLVQLKNVASLILVKLSGIVTEVRLVQP